jgi:hypothetical protein
MLKLHIKVSDLSIYSLCLMRVLPPVRAQNAAFAVENGPRTCHQSCPQRVYFEAQSVDNLPACNGMHYQCYVCMYVFMYVCMYVCTYVF